MVQLTLSATASPAAPAAPNPLVIEQYKAKLADLGNLGTRQTAMTTYYVSILSALLGIFAFKDRSLAEVDGAIVLAIAVPGILVSALWYTGIDFFRKLFRAKLQVLEEIEKALPFQTFAEEFAKMKSSGGTGWLRVERLVPLVFAAVFAGIACARFLR